MSAAERDFSNFELGDNVYELAGSAVREAADLLEVHLSGTPNTEELQIILDSMRNNKVLRDNEPITAIDRETKLALVERAGTQKPLDRSLWTPEIATDYDGHDDYLGAYLMVTAVANWQDRALKVVLESPKKPVYIAAGNRVMNSATEIVNPHVQTIFEVTGKHPTEAEYAGRVLLPQLLEAGFEANVLSYQTGDGNAIADQLMADTKLSDLAFAVVRNANAGIITAVQQRAAARLINPDFDTLDYAPDLFIKTDGFQLAYTAEQEADSANFQKVDPAFGQLLLVAKKIVEVTPG
jgi:hypothetical protein